MVDENVKEKLTKLLTKIFQFDISDLDFGIYKVLNYKKKEISEFINKDLIDEISKQLNLIGTEEQKRQKTELENVKKQLAELGIQDYENNPKYQEKKKQLENTKVSKELEREIYNHIFIFFSRYYEKGDFISKKRYGANEKYTIPYNGEEILLHWANNDQYYIKSTESFKKFSFRIPGLKISFRVKEAEEENGNGKSENDQFFFVSKKSYNFEGEELYIWFEFRGLNEKEKKKYQKPNQDKINEDNYESIKKSLSKESKAKGLLLEEDGKTLLNKNLYKFTRRNTSDYFIHKNLKSFLRRELDFYIKNEVVDLTDVTQLDVEHFNRYILEVKVLRNICTKVIDFLAQIEGFQKKLWEKKKFVLKTDYCITLDYVNEKCYAEILKNKLQLEEWKKLYGFDIKNKIKPLKGTLKGHGKETDEIKVLKHNPTLMIDTKFFDEEFKQNILETVPVSDDKINGLLIKSENFQVLNLLNKKYKEKIKVIHIDPPYNTATSGFLYKNNYQHSSWLSMMKDRIELGIDLISPKGSFLCHIDENEYEKLQLMFENFSIPDAGTIVWDKRNPMNAGRGVATQHEYIVFRSNWNNPIYLRNKNFLSLLEAADSIIKKHDGVTEEAKKEYVSWVSNNEHLSGGEKAYRYLDDEGRVYRPVSLRAPEPRVGKKFHKPLLHPITKKPCSMPPNGFSRTPETLLEMVKKGEILFGKDETTQPQQKRLLTEDSQRQISSVIQDGHKGKADVSPLGLDFPYCHPVSLYEELLGAVADSPNDMIIDYFAGSGTTGHAVLKLNKEDGGNRKFILVENGQHFENVTKPRILKIVYTQNWQDGKPQDSDGSLKHIIKYQYLEQYEDALENIEFSQKKLSEFSDYFVRYMLDFETKDSKTFLNIDHMKNPFNYKITVLEDYQQNETTVDLVETYNYLTGLNVEGFKTFYNNHDEDRKYLTIKGKINNKTAIIIWRNLEKLDQEKDRDFIQKNILKEKYDEVHINGDNLIKNAVLIEEHLKTLMN